MNEKFDELAKGLAQSVTRRGALQKFGVGLAGIALGSLGLASTAEAGGHCATNADCTGSNMPVCLDGRCKKATPIACNKCAYPYGCATQLCIANCDNICSGGGY